MPAAHAIWELEFLVKEQGARLCIQQIACAHAVQRADSINFTQTEAYVGHHCDVAQLGITNQYWPCAKLAAGFPSLFQKGPEYSFDPVFLAWGVNILETPQTLEGAEPAGYCAGPQGNGGIWMCTGVTWFTRTSVHWADSTTATSRV